MKNPSKEFLMLVDLMLEFNNLNISQQSQEFLEGLCNHLDPYEPFLEQQTAKQLKWLNDLHETHIQGDSEW